MKKTMLAIGSLLLLLSGCGLGQQGQPGSAEMSEQSQKQIRWAFTQAEQHPEKLLIEVIQSAKQTLDIAIYSLTHPDVVAAIKEAKKRGVDVRVITDKIQSGGKSQKEALKILGSAGIPIKINTHSGLMHLKVTIADGKVATTGSFNYSKSASTTNDEVIMVLPNEDIAKAFSAEFEAMWNDTKGFEEIKPRIAQDEGEQSPEADVADMEETDVSAAGDCSDPQIKGNITTKQEKIYHMPGGRSYKQTQAEMMFCTEDDAKAAGFKAAGK